MFIVLLLVAAGLGFYAYHLKAKVAAEKQRLAQQSQVVVPPASGPTTLVTLYVASDQEGGLRRTQVNVALPQERSERARAILRSLSHHVSAAGFTASHRRGIRCSRCLSVGKRYCCDRYQRWIRRLASLGRAG